MATFIPTCGDVITNAYRMLGAIDATEAPTAAEMAWALDMLNNTLRAEYADGASQYLISLQQFTIPALRQFFTIGAGANFHVNVDAVILRRLDMADFGNGTTRRETRAAPMVDIRRTLFPGLITKWNQFSQPDGSLKVFIWQPPRINALSEMELGGRVPLLTSAFSVIPFPPEGIAATEYILAARLRGNTGRPIEAVQDVLTLAAKYETSWNNYARGLQFLRMVR
jgi:hypothetical protein